MGQRRITLGDRADELIPGIPKHILSADQAAFRDIQFLDSGVNVFDEYKRERAIARPRPQTSVDVPLQVFPTDGQESSTLVRKDWAPRNAEEMQLYFRSVLSIDDLR